MTREEWEKGIQEWQQEGGLAVQKGSPANAPKSDPPSSDDGGWLGSAGAFGKGMLREGASQLGVAKDFAEGKDPQHSTAEGLGRAATDIAPSVALDAFVPEAALVPAALRGIKYAGPMIGSAVKGAIGGALANPGDRGQGGKTGAEVGAGSSMIGSALTSSLGNKAIWGGAGLAELARLVGAAHMPFISPWFIAHGLSGLGGLAKAAGTKAPATAGAIGSRVQQGLGQGE